MPIALADNARTTSEPRFKVIAAPDRLLRKTQSRPCSPSIADKDLAGVGKSPRLAIRKQKASATGEQIPFEMRLVTIDEDTTTLVVDWGEGGQEGAEHPSSEPNGKPWPVSLVIFKRVLDNTIANVGRRMRPFSDGPEVIAAKRESVRAEFLKLSGRQRQGEGHAARNWRSPAA